MKSGPILGIDFGTTNTSAAFFDAKGKLRLVPVGDGQVRAMTDVAYRVINQIQVGAEWRVGSGGAPTLDSTLGQDFVIKARLVAQSGHAADVTIVDAKPLSRL